jgi:hypothetical protein
MLFAFKNPRIPEAFIMIMEFAIIEIFGFGKPVDFFLLPNSADMQ